MMALTMAMFVACAARADAPQDQSIDVRVRIDGDVVVVDVDCFVRATREESWAVMTDFDNATKFITKLHESAVVSRTLDVLIVSQKGTMGFGPFSVPLDLVAEIRLTPVEKIQAHMIGGNMKKYEAVTTLFRDPEGTRVAYHVESIPDVWIPPLIGRAMVEYETRARFRQLLDEILRRKASPKTGK